MIDFLTLNRATLWDKIRLAYFPLSLPLLFAGLRVGATLAVIGAIVAEFSGIPVGLGRNLYISALRLEPELMMSTVSSGVRQQIAPRLGPRGCARCD